MKKNLLFVLFIAYQLVANFAGAQLSGLVFRDINSNGVKDNTASFNEPFVQGVTIKVYNTADVNIATATTDVNGAYSFTGLSFPVRIEFSGFQTGDYSAVSGSGNNSAVQFYSAATSSANFAVTYPAQYSQPNPPLATNMYVEGDAPATPGNPVLVSVPFTASGSSILHTNEADHTQIGSTWALAYHRSSKILFAAAYQKRHTSYGSGNSTGVIYKIPSPSDNSTTGVSVFLDLNQLYHTNVAGDNPHPNGSTNFKTDEDSYDQTGMVALGGMDIDEEEKNLWVVNLYDRQLYKIPLGSDVNNPVAPTLVSQVKRYPLYNKCDCDGSGGLDNSSGKDLRPFALKVYRGNIYLGMVCSAFSTPSDFSKLKAYVFQFNPQTETFTQVLNFPLNYDRGTGNSAIGWNLSPVPGGYGGSNTANWRPWDDSYDRRELSWYDAGWREGGFPQPMLTDIEFDEVGNMTLGLRDRFGDMVGDGTNEPNGSAVLLESDGVGDILHAPYSSGGWTMNMTGATDGTEFYLNDNYYGAHLETSNGGLAIPAGSDIVVNTVMDPLSNISFGLDFANNKTGDLPRSYQVYRRPSGSAATDYYFAKSNGNGDVEIICETPPMEIGNRVWFDSDYDGIQDAGENGLAGVVLQLVDKAGIVVAEVTTNSSGNYYFSSASGTSTTGVTYNVTILPNSDYTVRVKAAATTLFSIVTPTLSSAQYFTLANRIGSGVPDWSDNDGVLSGGVGGHYQASLTTGIPGASNHSIDFGFTNFRVLPLKWIYFNASVKEEGVELQWKVQAQDNVKEYVVEFSADGRTFNPIINAPVTASDVYMALHVYAPAGTNYYRVKAVSNDGAFSYSNVQKISLTANVKGVSVFPNPASGIVKVSVPSSMVNKPLLISILTVDGKLLMVQKSAYAEKQEMLDVSGFASGKYVLRVENEKGFASKTLQVIH